MSLERWLMVGIAHILCLATLLRQLGNFCINVCIEIQFNCPKSLFPFIYFLILYFYLSTIFLVRQTTFVFIEKMEIHEFL